MKPQEIFPDPLDMMEYIEWLKSDESTELVENYYNDTMGYITGINPRYSLIIEAHTLLSQPLREDMFVRPEEPQLKDFKIKRSTHSFYKSGDGEYMEYEFNTKHQAWENWEPIFKGDWYFSGDYLGYNKRLEMKINDKTLNDFIKYCKQQNIKLEWV